MIYVISAVWAFLEIACFIFFCNTYLTLRWSKKIAFLAFSCVGVFGLVNINFTIIPIPAVYVSLVMFWGISFFLYNGSGPLKVLVPIIYYIFVGVIDTLAAYGVSAFLDISLEEFYTKELLYTAAVTTGKLLEVLLAWLLCNLWSKRGFRKIEGKWLLLMLLFPTVSLTMLLVIFESYRTRTDLSMRAFLFSCILAIANFAILYLINTLEKATREKQQLALLNQQMAIQKGSLLALEQSYRAQRKSSHEFSHHLQVINDLLDGEQYLDARSYVQKLEGLQTARVLAVNSHHPIIDAILNQKYQEAKEHHIKMQMQVNDLSQTVVPVESLVVLLSNLLDNAIEACDHYDGKKVIRCTLLAGESLFLSISNTTNPVNIVDGKIETNKEPKEEHGYGLANVARIFHDLNGEYALDAEDGWFYFVGEIPNIH